MRDAQWPTVEEAVKRIAIRIGDHSSTDVVEMNAADLIVVMREIGRLTAEAKQRSQPRVGIYERLEELEAENAKLKAALAAARQPQGSGEALSVQAFKDYVERASDDEQVRTKLAVETMRAKCEAIARAEMSDWRGSSGAIKRIVDAIAALAAAGHTQGGGG